LSIGASGGAPLAGFALGFGLPWLVGRLGGGELIVRRGGDERACTARVATSELRV
jgi:hypothetical protein